MTRDEAIQQIAWAYRKLRTDCSHLEHVLQTITDSSSEAISDKEMKRLDKAVTVMKVGFKIVKKVSGASKRGERA